MPDTPSEAGFSLIEVLVGAALAALLILLLLRLLHGAAIATEHLDARAQAMAAAGALVERLDRDATSAWSMGAPVLDCLGRSNADGHELDFAREDAMHRIAIWAYTFDPARATVTRYAYAPGVAPLAGTTYAPLQSFIVTSFAASALRDPASAIYDPLFASASIADARMSFPSGAPLDAGNRILRVQIAGIGVLRDERFASATAPAHFTIIATYTPTPAPLATATPTPLPLVQL